MERTRVLEKKGMIYDPTTQHQISDEYCPNAQMNDSRESFNFVGQHRCLGFGYDPRIQPMGHQLKRRSSSCLRQLGWVSNPNRKEKITKKQTRGVERTICHQPQKQICLGRTAGWGRRWRREVSEPGLELPDSSPSPSLATSTPAYQSSLLHFSVAPKPSSSPATTQILGLIYFFLVQSSSMPAARMPCHFSRTPGNL